MNNERVHKAATPRRPTPRQLPTLLERLRTVHTSGGGDADTEHTLTRSRMREIVRDALVELLNTTNLEHEIPAQYDEVRASVLNYGIPPLAGGYISDMKWMEVERMIRRAIIRFEPRIIPETLHITPPDPESEKHAGNALRFTIHAMIHMEPYPIEFNLLSNMDLETNSLEATLIKN